MPRDMTEPRRIAILTGGGDVPGLNAVIKSVVYRATEAGYYDARHPPRLGGPHPSPARHRTPTRPTCDRSTGSTPGPSNGPVARSCTPRGRTRARCAPPGCRPGWTRPRAPAYAVGDGVFDLTPLVLDNLAALGIDVLVTIGGDDTLSYSQVLVNAGRAAHRDPQDDGQRRPGHRVLHRLLDRDHPGQGGDQPPADDARQPRADRRLPDLRARRRVLGAVHGVRHVGALRDPRGALRPRRAVPRCSRPTTPRTRATTPS